MDGPEEGLRVTASVVIPASELDWRFGPSGGPGGQHANRAHTRAEVRFDIEGSPSLTEGQRNRIMAKIGTGLLIVSADDERSQLRNRRLALDRLRLRLADALVIERPRRPTRPGRGAVERRLDAKRRQSARKTERRRPHDD